MYQHMGRKGRDRITGFEGVVTGHCEYLTGCHQTLLIPPVDDKGAARDGQWFDDQRIEILADAAIVLDNGDTPGCDIPAPIR